MFKRSMGSAMRNHLKICEQRLQILFRTASELLAKMEELHTVRELLANAIMGPVVAAVSRTKAHEVVEIKRRQLLLGR
jgi:hypothetical protein